MSPQSPALTEDEVRTELAGLIARFNDEPRPESDSYQEYHLSSARLTLTVVTYIDAIEVQVFVGPPASTQNLGTQVRGLVAQVGLTAISSDPVNETAAHSGVVALFRGLGPDEFPDLKLRLLPAI